MVSRFIERALAARLHPKAFRGTAAGLSDLRQAVEARTAALNASTATVAALPKRIETTRSQHGLKGAL
jgi:hypothetical protein